MNSSADRLEELSAGARRLRDLEREVADAEARLKELKAQQQVLLTQTLPDLFDEAGVDHVGLPAEGNLPACDVRIKDHYYAHIAPSWPPEKQSAAFEWLDENGHGDLIKTNIVVSLGRGSRAAVASLKEYLRKAELGYDEKMGVPWNTLTAWMKDLHLRGRTPPMGVVGGSITRVAELKPRK